MSVTLPSVDPTAVRAALAQRAKDWYRLAIIQIAGGIFASVTLPLLLAVLSMMGVGHSLGWHVRLTMAEFAMWFAIWLVILMPIAYILEWFTHGNFLMQRLEQIQNSDGGLFEAATHSRSWRRDDRGDAALWEIALFAPRLVFTGFAQLHTIRLVAVADTTRAADVLSALLARDHGLPTATLQARGENALTFSQVMSCLLFYEWIGVSADGAKVWALSESRDDIRPS